MTDHTHILLALARRLAEPYAALPETRAIMLTGSVAEGLCDDHSDVDLMVYYESLPDEDALAAARTAVGGGDRNWVLGDRAEGGFAESFPVAGVECQVAHSTVAAWEERIDRVMSGEEVASPVHKAMQGTLTGMPLLGTPLVQSWQTRVAQFPPALGDKMVRHYLQFFPIWGLERRLAGRDALLWQHQIFVEGAQNLLGVLAGLNQRYFTTFQFKRLHHFVDALAIRPDRLAERLGSLLLPDRQTAAATYEALVAETLALVNEHMPSVDTSIVARPPGWRHAPWQPEAVHAHLMAMESGRARVS